ncbi:unnamed protein product [Adineta steineri]|uniref:Uncharacterized protein n=1 Tax=Adineta steineri TaxID=433720 RepID=A0A815Q149_9BILA|nr:unnamed protein product [Adineta steineri]
MNCILLFHFILLLISIVLLIFGISTPRWLVYINENTNGIISEYSHGIIENCRRFYQHSNDNATYNNIHINDNAYICFNYLYKWHNTSRNGYDLPDYQKILIGISFSCICIAVISLLLTQLINIKIPFYKIHFSKRIIDCLLITNILTAILAMITLTLFFGFEHLQHILNCGYSFWLFVMGTCCIFVCCILIAIFRIDVEFEFHRYYHESVATLC